LPAEHRQFKDDGTYPNLAQVPARPVNLPTFAEAKKVEKALLADNEKQKAPSPQSPAAPSIDSSPQKVATAATPPVTASVAPVAAGTPRTEDKSPCLSASPTPGTPTATIRFAPGSSAITSDDLQVLAELMPTIRGANGTIRLFGHGDTDENARQGAGRFDLAAARAGAVAQALAGFGIPVPKIAVGVACRDAATSGASVQLFAES
jgi:outer membrane protein OmpA-like peptidoglycan-associated protein